MNTENYLHKLSRSTKTIHEIYRIFCYYDSGVLVTNYLDREDLIYLILENRHRRYGIAYAEDPWLDTAHFKGLIVLNPDSLLSVLNEELRPTDYNRIYRQQHQNTYSISRETPSSHATRSHINRYDD